MKNHKKVNSIIAAYHDTEFDPNGSYTGKPKGKEHPVQDADDL